MRRRILLSVLACLLLASCRRAPSDPRVPDRVRVQMLPFLSFAPLQIAIDEGYFRDENIVVDPVRLDNIKSIPALLDGQIDVYSGTLTAGFFNAAAHGGKIAIVANKGHAPSGGCVSDAIMLRAGAPAPDGAGSLPLYRIAAGKATMTEYEADRFIGATRSTSRFETVNLAPAEVLAAMANGSIDLRNVSEPQITQLQRAGSARIWQPTSSFAPDAEIGVIAFGPRLLQQDRALGVRFLRAYLRGVARYAEGKTPRNLEIVSRLTGVDRATLAQSCWTPVRAGAAVNEASIADFVSWAVEKHYLDLAQPYPRFVDAEPLRQAVAGKR